MDPIAHKVLRFDRFQLDLTRGCLRTGEQEIDLRPKAFQLLAYLAANAGRLLPKQELIEAVWPNVVVSDESLEQCIRQLRQGLGDADHRLIKTMPRRGYLFDVTTSASEVAVAITPQAIATNTVEAPSPVLPLPDRPSIAVLPFANLGGNPEQEYLCDGIVEDVITELSRFRELFVIAHNSSFRYKGRCGDVRQVGRELGVHYVLQGSIRCAGGRIRIVGQLIDTATGAHRWAEHYDRELRDIFVVQDEVARTIVGIIVAHVNKAEAERTLLKAPATWQAYDHYMRAADTLASFWSSLKVETLYETRRLLEHCLAIDPNYARAYGLLAHTHLASGLNPVNSDFLNPAPLDRAQQLAAQAVQLDPYSPQAHVHLGSALIWKCQHDSAIMMFERAIALNPNFTDWRYAIPLIYSGQFPRAIEVFEARQRRDPFVPPYALAWLGFAYYMLKRYSDALPPLHECVSRAGYWFGHVALAATYAQLGELERAETATAEVRRRAPAFKIASGDRFKHSKDAQHYFDGLRKANLPAN